MGTKKRFVLEGEWSGYVSSQQRVVHREVVTGAMAEKLSGVYSIGFTDGTQLRLKVSPCKPREKVRGLVDRKAKLKAEVLERLHSAAETTPSPATPQPDSAESTCSGKPASALPEPDW